MSSRRQDALDYHAQGRPGKIQVSPTKPFKNQRDLSLAYTPGVAEPCREIAERPDEAYTYTAKGNLVCRLLLEKKNTPSRDVQPPRGFAHRLALRDRHHRGHASV